MSSLYWLCDDGTRIDMSEKAAEIVAAHRRLAWSQRVMLALCALLALATVWSVRSGLTVWECGAAPVTSSDSTAWPIGSDTSWDPRPGDLGSERAR